MQFRIKTLATIAASAAAVGLAGNASAQDIVFSGGGADITWFYDSGEDSWDVVFRSKGNTQATGLTNPYAGPPGGVGAGSDFNFDTLTVDVQEPILRVLNGTPYFSAGPSGQTQTPDLGIRTRLRELDESENQIDQFDSFRLVLDWANSTKPTGAEFAMWNFDGDGNPIILYETAQSDLTHDWPAWGHTHWVWGFSQLGDYELAFTFEGLGGEHGPSALGSTSVNFSVIPEPTTAGLLIAGAGALLMRRRRATA
jgi:hypothetical protein